MAFIFILVTLTCLSLVSCDSLDVNSWQTALETKDQEVVRDQLVAIHKIAIDATPKAQELMSQSSNLTFGLYETILDTSVDRNAALNVISLFLAECESFLTDKSMDEGDKWFIERSPHTPVSGDIRLFFDIAFVSFSEANKDLVSIRQAVYLLEQKLGDRKLSDQEIKINTVVFFKTLGQRDTTGLLNKTVMALNQFFAKWITE